MNSLSNFSNIFLAILPLLITFFLLFGLRKNIKTSGIITLISIILISVLPTPFNMKYTEIFISIMKGALSLINIFYILFPSLILYQIIKIFQSADTLIRLFSRVIPDINIQILMIVIGFSPLTESISGFGVGAILSMPLISALGMTNLQSALLGSLGQVAVPWGGLAVGTELAANLTNLNPKILGAYTAILIFPIPIIYGLISLFITGGIKAVKLNWPAAVLVGVTLSACLYGFSLFIGIDVAGILASLVSMITLLLYQRLFKGKTNKFTQFKVQNISDNRDSIKSTLIKLLPYILLTIFLLLSRLITPVKDWLNHLKINYSFLDANFHGNLPIIYHPGFFIIMTSVISVLCIRSNTLSTKSIFIEAWKKFCPGGITITCFVITSQVMQDNGMNELLGSTVSLAGNASQFITPWLAALGAWMTGSSTGSNALFSQLQNQISIQSGLPSIWIIAAQNAASAHGTLISPARTALISTVAFLKNQEKDLLKSLAPIVIGSIIITNLFLYLMTLKAAL